MRSCNDFQKLNEASQFDAHPIPQIDELIDQLGKNRFLSTLSLTKAYWQIPLAETAKGKTTFSMTKGLYQYTVLPFGGQSISRDSKWLHMLYFPLHHQAFPLTNLIKAKGLDIVKRSSAAEAAVLDRRTAHGSNPVLIVPDFKEFILQADASKVQLGAVPSSGRRGKTPCLRPQ